MPTAPVSTATCQINLTVHTAPQAPPFTTHVLCHKEDTAALSSGLSTHDPFQDLCCLLHRDRFLQQAAPLCSGSDTAKEAHYWQHSFGTSQCSLFLNHWGTNSLHSKSAPIPPALHRDSWDRGTAQPASQGTRALTFRAFRYSQNKYISV